MFNGSQSSLSQEGLDSDESSYPSLFSEEQDLNSAQISEGRLVYPGLLLTFS